MLYGVSTKYGDMDTKSFGLKNARQLKKSRLKTKGFGP